MNLAQRSQKDFTQNVEQASTNVKRKFCSTKEKENIAVQVLASISKNFYGINKK